MTPYKVTQSAMNEFVSTLIATVTPAATGVMPRVQCTSECLALRPSRFTQTGCNGFVYQDGVCKLGYKDPNWVVEQSQKPGEAGKIYFDIYLP